MTHPLLDLAPLSAARFAEIEDRVARLLDTRQDVVIMQGEALLPLEGAIRGTAGPGTTALNVITGPYGQTFGNWLRDCGAKVIDLAVPFHTAVTAEQTWWMTGVSGQVISGSAWAAAGAQPRPVPAARAAATTANAAHRRLRSGRDIAVAREAS